MLPGGKRFDPREFDKEVVRAEMVALISQHCLEHASKITDSLIRNFDVTRRPIKEKIA